MIYNYYNELMVPDLDLTNSISKSPLKPKLVYDNLIKYTNKLEHKIVDFVPFTKDDFLLAHTKKYVNSIYNKNDINEFNITDSYISSLEYTNASLYNAILGSINRPEHLHVSLTSGFHHATPYESKGFCTFSGQVIASTKIYKDLGLVGCYLDLDAHFGNSIEDSRVYTYNLNNAIPEWANFNPDGFYDDYINNFTSYLYNVLELKIINKECDYIVYCHGTDSIDGDDLKSSKVSLKEWYTCTLILKEWYNKLCKKINRNIPLSMSLFGGYRENDYDFIINAHTTDILLLSN